MNVKEYLMQIRTWNSQIDEKLAEVNKLREMACSISLNTDGDRVQTSGPSDKIGSAVAKIIDLEEEIDRDIDRLVDLKREAMKMIDELRSPYCDVLYKRYFQFKTWELIAVETSYNIRTIYKIHGKALQKIKVGIKGHYEQ